MTKQGPVSTMQKTSWTIHSSFLVLPGLEKGFTLDVITRGAVNNHSPMYLAIFSMVTTNDQTTKQASGPSKSLLLTSEKAVFCNSYTGRKHTYPQMTRCSILA